MRFLLLFLFTLPCFAQSSTAVLYINVACTDPACKPVINDYNINVNRVKGNNEKEHYYTPKVKGKENLFTAQVPKGKRFKVGLWMQNDYYRTDTIINTGSNDSVFVTLKLRPKKYVYTEAKAREDIQNGIVRFITFDKGHWGTKIDVKKQFGFEYLLLDKPVDRDFKHEMDLYTLAMKLHLFSVDSTWAERYGHITDSITHHNADSYTQLHTIDISALKVPRYRRLPPEMKLLVKARKEFWMERYQSALKNFSVSQMLDSLDNSNNYFYVKGATIWLRKHYCEAIPELIKRITTKKEVGLINTADLAMWERCESGDLKVYDHGPIVVDDLFTVAGRANYLLGEITGEYFGRVSMYAAEADLKKLQNRWAYWLLQLQDKL
jgi:hypothetical protein